MELLMSRMDNVWCSYGFFGERTQIIVSTNNEGDQCRKTYILKQLHVK